MLRAEQLEDRLVPSACSDWFDYTDPADYGETSEWVTGPEGELSLVAGGCELVIWQQLTPEAEAQILDLAASFIVELPDSAPEPDFCLDDSQNDVIQEAADGCALLESGADLDDARFVLNQVLATTEERRNHASRLVTAARNRFRELVEDPNSNPAQLSQAAINLRLWSSSYRQINYDYLAYMDLLALPREELWDAIVAHYNFKRAKAAEYKGISDQAIANLHQRVLGPSMADDLIRAADTAAWASELYRQYSIGLDDITSILEAARALEEN